MNALQLQDRFKASGSWLAGGGVLLLLAMLALILTESPLVPPLAIGLLFLAPPSALMFYLKLTRPELLRAQFAMLFSICLFLWGSGVIVILLVWSWYR